MQSGNKLFITENFLLQTGFARNLYYGYAANLPIIDYHNHLSPSQVANNHFFSTITEAWLAGDHYKWRAMRTFGIPEEYITGGGNDEEKFKKWAEVVPYTLRNPLYHWTHLELQRYFGINALLNEKNASEVYYSTSSKLQQPTHSAQGLLKQMNVEVICTTDDPADSLDAHNTSIGKMPFTMLPTFRPDRSYQIEKPGVFKAYCEKLSTAAGIEITSFDTLLEALKNRIEYFHKLGCRLADHGLEQLYYFEGSNLNARFIFEKTQNQIAPTPKEAMYFKFAVLSELCSIYHSKGWVQQFHLGALRNNNQYMLNKLGPDSGYDSIGDFNQAESLNRFLNMLEKKQQLAKTILYNLNPSQNEVFATITGNFCEEGIRGKIQFGSAWWFLDQKDGIEKQLNALSNMGLLSCFVGMLTDSRSFLSFPRHEYFRRILCNLIGNDVKNGELPEDEKLLGALVQNICYYNAKNYFKF